MTDLLIDANTEKEIRAMAEIGERRLRTRTAIFAIAVIAVVILLSGLSVFGVHLGLLYRLFIAAPVAAALSFIIARPFNEKFITEAAAKYDLPRESLAADKYLID